MTGAALRRPAVVLLAGYLAALALVGFWPTPVERPAAGLLRSVLRFLQEQPLTAGIRAGHVEVAANVALFVPLGVLAAMLLPARRWWMAAAAGLLGSAAIEVVQFLALDQRQGSLRDVASNTAGALLGALAVVWVRRRRSKTSKTPVSGDNVPGRNSMITIAATADVAESASIGDGSRIWHLAQIREEASLGQQLQYRARSLHRAGRRAGRQLQSPKLRPRLRTGAAVRRRLHRPRGGAHQRPSSRGPSPLTGR